MPLLKPQFVVREEQKKQDQAVKAPVIWPWLQTTMMKKKITTMATMIMILMKMMVMAQGDRTFNVPPLEFTIEHSSIFLNSHNDSRKHFQYREEKFKLEIN